MKWFNQERTKTVLTFPVETMALLSDGKNRILDEEYEKFTAEMYAEGHSFFTYISDNPNGLSSCCRLRNEVEDNEFSFTNGLSGVATGSKSVITLNLNRIVQNYAKSKSKDKGEFKEYLIKILDRVYKYHHAYNELLKDLQASNMLPVYDAGFISLNQQFLTIGINGMNEAAEFLGLECSDNPEYQAFVDSVCSTISEQNKLHKTKDMKFNQEYVPAENLGVKNYRWDKEAGYKVPKDRNAYNSYFYLPDNEDTEILERFRLQGRRYTQNLDGGVALHCNLQEHLSEEQYLKLMRYAVQEGCSYITFNVKNSICNECGYISKHTIDKCPHCGSPNIDWITRIIGYLKRIANFSEARQQEASRRVYK